MISIIGHIILGLLIGRCSMFIFNIIKLLSIKQKGERRDWMGTNSIGYYYDTIMERMYILRLIPDDWKRILKYLWWMNLNIPQTYYFIIILLLLLNYNISYIIILIILPNLISSAFNRR